MSFRPRTGAELQAARRAAAERFTAIAWKHTPGDIIVEMNRTNLSGRAYVNAKTIHVPKPVTRRALHIFLHEVAHVLLGHGTADWCPPPKPRYVEEFEAERWALDVMRKEGVAIPRKVTASARAYVARKIRQAEKRGAKHIDPRARAFADGR